MKHENAFGGSRICPDKLIGLALSKQKWKLINEKYFSKITFTSNFAQN
jgi:hypothetical protein